MGTLNSLPTSAAEPAKATHAPWEISLGCELQPVLFGSIQKLKLAALLDHLQVTVPSTISCLEALELTSRTPVIAHCNLLNTLGENDWQEMKAVARQVRSLKPVHVVEHFTAFRTGERTKHGVCFSPEMRLSLETIIEGILRWQDLLGTPLCLENVPVATEAHAYFDFMLEVVSKTGVSVACDVPHFLLSAHSVGMTDVEMKVLAKDLKPLQLHVGGLSVSQGILRDNHKVFSPWTATRARELFESARYVTLEQNHQIPASSVERYLTQIRELNPEHAPPILAALGIEQEPLNRELAADSAKNNGYGAPVRDQPQSFQASVEAPLSAIDLYEKYLPFLYPIESIQEIMDETLPLDAIQMVTRLCRWSLSYLSWWSPATPALMRISYGEGSERRFEQTLGARGTKEETKTFADCKRVFRFTSRKGYWVEVAAPSIPEFTAAESKRSMT